MAKGKTLVVYYSLSGTTKAVASLIAQALHADLEEIVPDGGSARGFRLFIQIGLGAMLGRAWTVRPSPHDLASYGLVIVGGPIWMGRIAAPLRGWLQVHGLASHTAFAAFFTLNASDCRAAFAELEALAGRRTLARLAILQRDQAQGKRAELIGDFVQFLARVQVAK